jgi:hypothetical protein
MYDFQFPTCFCSKETEICVSVPPLKKFRNEFVARCESGDCEYLGAYSSLHVMALELISTF